MSSNFYAWVKDERELKNPNAKCSSPHPESCPYHGTKQLDKTDAENKDAGRGGDDVAQMDAAYADAVNRGDRETALKMIRQAAAKAFPNTKVVDKDGLPQIVWHGGTFNRKGNYKAKGAMHFGTIGAALERICGEISGYVDKDSDGNYYSYDGNDEKITGTPHSVKIDAYKELAKTSDITVHPYLLNIEKPAWTEDRVEDPEFDEEQGIKSRIADKTYKNDGFDGNEYVNNIEDAGSTSWVAYSPNQIKSADITYDDDGNLIPLSKRFDDGDDIRGDVSKKDESLLPEDDAEMDRMYLDAVKSGNAEVCAAMVKERAKKMMPHTKIVDDDGSPKVTYHIGTLGGTGAWTPLVDGSTAPDNSLGIHFGSYKAAMDRTSRWLHDDQIVAEREKNGTWTWRTESEHLDWMNDGRGDGYRSEDEAKLAALQHLRDLRMTKAYLNLENPTFGTDEDAQVYNLYEWSSKNDGMVYKNEYEDKGNDSYLVMKPSAIKLADPITYDDNGAVIPLSKRFDFKNHDIRY